MAIATIKLSGGSRRTIQRSRLRGDRLVRGLPQALDHAGWLLADEIKVKEFGPGKTINVVTNQMRRSVASRVTGSGDAYAVMIGITKGPASSYAAIHERGGVIRAKGRGALAIPIGRARTATGKPRFPGGPHEAARKHPEMFMLKRSGKPPLLVRPLRVAGRSGGKIRGIEPLFVLLKSVRIPPRRWLSGGVERGIRVFQVDLQASIDRLVAE
jgi:hypothetical protein